jgi:hypothetical protein
VARTQSRGSGGRLVNDHCHGNHKSAAAFEELHELAQPVARAQNVIQKDHRLAHVGADQGNLPGRRRYGNALSWTMTSGSFLLSCCQSQGLFCCVALRGQKPDDNRNSHSRNESYGMPALVALNSTIGAFPYRAVARFPAQVCRAIRP